MKGKKILSWVLAAALCLSASVLPAAAAASFPDVTDHWAVEYIDDTVKKGIFVGIDVGGVMKFVPDRPISVSEVLTTCARISVDSQTRGEIAAARADQMKNLISEELSWFRNSAAVCVEAGILSYSELKSLYDSGALRKNATREDFAFYLVRAMQLEPMAKNLPSYTLNFTDKKNITPGYEPYIYVLNMYGIITGTDGGAFAPKVEVDRAMAATMLSKATDFMEEQGTSVELSEYTDYDWTAGTVVAATAGSKGVTLLTLSSELSGTKTISLPDGTPIYRNSMLSDESLLKAGTYARVNLDNSGLPIDVRLSGSTQTYTGSVVGINGDSIILNVSGSTTTLYYDRFTEVQAGNKTGDRAVIDLKAGYTTATCLMDELGHMVSLRLAGGTHEAVGLISGVETFTDGSTSLKVTGFDGQSQKYTVPSGGVLAPSGLPVAANEISTYAGSYVSLRVSNDNGSTAVTATVDTVTKYIQGSIKATSVEEGINTVTINNLSTNKATTYKATTNATYQYQDAATTYGALQKDWFVTARIAGGELAALWAYPGSSITEGIAAISFPGGATPKAILSVTQTNGAVATFEFSLTGTLPEVTRAGKSSSLERVLSGDTVKVTVRYNSVILVEATPRSANVTGTITEKTDSASGVRITVKLDNDGSSATYHLTADVRVTQGDKPLTLAQLQYGNHIAMVTNGDQVSSIEVDKASASSDSELTGTVILVNKDEKTILLRLPQTGTIDNTITISVPTGTTIIDVANEGRTSLSKLYDNQMAGKPITLTVYGGYVGADFKANYVICKK